MEKKEKEYIEPEILNKGFKKAEKFGEEKFDMMGGQIKSIKKAILMRGAMTLIIPILIFILIVGGIASLIMYVIDTHPYDYIVTGVFLFFVLKPIYKLIKMFK